MNEIEWNKSSIHFIHQQIANGKVDFEKIGTHLNMADSGTQEQSQILHQHTFDSLIKVLESASIHQQTQNITSFWNLIKLLSLPTQKMTTKHI